MPNIRSNLSPKCARGYIYDAESQLYYCQSRYYDPAIGRFINADAFASTGQGIIGNNMFAYCGNSPVSYVDPSGYLFVPYDTLPGWTEDPSENSSPESRQSLGEIEITVLKAKGISVYNGVPVIKLPFGGDVGFSAGVIFLGDGVPANENGISMLKHEYGHVVHLSQIGWESYVTWVIIPSVINYHKGVKYAD